jgi:hypothetical protein
LTVDDVDVGILVVEGLGIMELVEVGLGLGVELWLGELGGTVGVKVGCCELGVEKLLVKYQIPIKAIRIIIKSIRSFGQVRNFLAIQNSL